MGVLTKAETIFQWIDFMITHWKNAFNDENSKLSKDSKDRCKPILSYKI